METNYMDGELINILLIEDDAEDAMIIAEMLHYNGRSVFKLNHVRRLTDGLQLIDNKTFDVILVDLGLPDSQGIGTFQLVNRCAPHLPVIVLTGINSEALGHTAVQEGAQDYLVKNEVTGTLLKRSILHAIERKQEAEVLRRSEQKYRDLSNLLTEANNMKDLLLDVITHDLKNNAGVIYGFTDLLLMQYPGNDICQNIQLSAQSLLKVIENASTLARLSLGEKIEMALLNLEHMLEVIVREYTPSAISADSLKIEFNPKGPLMVRANPIIAEVFRNYLSNAIKYGYEGGLIQVDAEIKDEYFMVTVSDWGDTIPEDKREVIFERMVRLSEKKEGGYGLGLAIVRRITDAHLGSSWVEPNQPKGNRFFMRIPA